MADLSLLDLSGQPKWRTFAGYDHIRVGMSGMSDAGLVWSIAPGEWTVLGDRPNQAIDMTHARAMFRLGGGGAADLLNRVCALDLGDGMFPNGAAARTIFAGVAAELVRHDQAQTRSYLILPPSSFRTYIIEVIEDAGADLGLPKGIERESR